MLESQFRALLEAAPDAMVIVDAAGTIVLVNTQTERLFGYARTELVGQKVDILVPMRFRGRHPDHRARYSATPGPSLPEGAPDGAAERAAETSRATDARVREMGSGLELFAVRRDGTEFPVEISLSPIETADGVLVTSAIRDITERKRARQKDLLLKEIHHRVKNNLQVISSLLKLHAEQLAIPEARAAFEEAEQRVRAIAMLHEHLHETQGSGTVEFASYARLLAEALMRLAGVDVRLVLEVSDVHLSLDQALPCGLILNELMSNALKHAWPPTFTGVRSLAVRASRVERDVLLEVSDNGVGFPAELRVGSLGLHLVRTLSRQLAGALTLSSDGGAVARLKFPGDLPKSVP